MISVSAYVIYEGVIPLGKIAFFLASEVTSFATKYCSIRSRYASQFSTVASNSPMFPNECFAAISNYSSSPNVISPAILLTRNNGKKQR